MKKNHSTSFFLSLAVSLLAMAICVCASSAAAADYDFSIITDSDTYNAMDTVKIRMKNTGTRTLSLKNMWWQVETKEGTSGREVFTEPNMPDGASVHLQPGETVTWTWDTRDNEGVAQPAGAYRIKVGISMPKAEYEGAKYSEPFRISAGAEKTEVTLTCDKERYRAGDTVVFTLKNSGTTILDTSRFTWIIYRITESGPIASSSHTERPGAVPDPMLSGDLAHWEWDMVNDLGSTVTPGHFELEVQLLDEGLEGNCFFTVFPE
ncbi:MAG: hypothetical protein JW885_11885 [Deltaproteobacteria bacterium]|nr:hypothetical protein [Candidatus Zymogenaceae bacterium]